MDGPVQVTRAASVLLAPNPSVMTLDGTNSWLLRGVAGGPAVLVDPGPAHPSHLAALARCGDLALVLLTHGHADHAEASAVVAHAAGVPVRAADPALCRDGDPLVEGVEVVVGDLRIAVLATPGHTADSVCLRLPDDGPHGSVLTGDTVLGRGTTVVAHPDGRLADYLESLERLAALGPATVLPGHGPVLPDLAAATHGYLAHRRQRLEQVRAATAAGHVTPDAVVRVVYADVDRRLWPAAERSVAAQLAYLAGDTRPAPRGRT